MTLALFLQAGDAISFPWTQYVNAGSSVLLVAIALYCLLKALPTWRAVKDGEKEIRLAEISVREKEAEARTVQASSWGQLSEVLNNVAVKNHQETEGIRIMQRVASDSSERMEEMVNGLVGSVEDISKRLAHVEHQLNTQGKSHGTKA